MSPIHAIILGIVEGITEFLPISSTGHLILASTLLGIQQTEFVKTFEIAIQLGAIAAVLVLYWRSFLDLEIVKRVLAGFIPTAIIGLALYSFVKHHLLGNIAVVLWALAIGGLFLIVFELFHKERADAPDSIKSISYKNAVLIGIFQSIAVIPGVSRSAATIVGGLFLGIKRVTIVEFSFLLAVPTLAAATGLDLLKNYQTFTTDSLFSLVLGFVAAFVVALIAIKLLLGVVRKYTFIPFGVYRIVVALAFWLLVIGP